MEQRNCIIVHGSADDENDKEYNRHWMKWIKKKLEEKNIKVFAPNMPNPWKPDYNIYKREFDKLDVDENTILIGHSSGCAFLVRWLGESQGRVRKLILVAPWKISSKEFSKEENELYNFKINNRIKKRFKEIVIFISNDGEEDGKKSARIFHDVLGGRIIELKNHGHFTKEDMGTEEFPELLKVILNGK